MKIKKALLSAVACCLLLSGCSMTGLDNTELMRPPKATGDKAEIQAVIDEQAGDNYTFKYPQRGDYRSAVIMQDLDADGKSEAIAFYRNSSNESNPVTHLIIIAEKKGIWECVGSYENQSTEVDCVVFADLDGDGTTELVTGWGAYSGSTNQLTAYSYNGSGSNEIPIDPALTYASFTTGDYTGDGSAEIMLLSLSSAEMQSSALMLDWNYDNSSLYTLNTAVLDPNVSKFIDVSNQQIAENQIAVIAEGASAVGTYATQVILYDKTKETLKNELYSDKTSNLTLRDTAVFSKDINGDGIFEIPTVSKMNSESGEDLSTVASQTVWNTYNVKTDKLEPVVTTVSDIEHGYSYIIDMDWQDEITARVNLSDSSITFYQWVHSDKKESKGDKLLTIRAVEASKWTSGSEYEGYTLIDKNDSYAYGYIIADVENDLIPSEEQIISNFLADNATTANS